MTPRRGNLHPLTVILQSIGTPESEEPGGAHPPGSKFINKVYLINRLLADQAAFGSFHHNLCCGANVEFDTQLVLDTVNGTACSADFFGDLFG